MSANGTWRQLRRTPAGWQPQHGKNDSGLWQVLPPPAADTTVTAALVRFVAAPYASAGAPASLTSPGATPKGNEPQQWTVRVMLTVPPHVRAQFVEGRIVANYRRLVPSTSGGPTTSA
jgi:hypothetical protein